MFVSAAYYTGSPFFHAVLDGRRATASGEGLEHIIANRPTSFDVKTKSVGGEAELEVFVRGKSRAKTAAYLLETNCWYTLISGGVTAIHV